MKKIAGPDFLTKIIELECTGSTNTYAGELLKAISTQQEGTVIWAHQQTKGKGLGDNTWTSEPGLNLTFSLVLRPLFLPPDRQFMLNKTIALGVLDFAVAQGIPDECRLKWPNDIYAGKNKLAGILINNTISGSEYSSAITGIGFNVNQSVFDPTLPNPVSLKMLCGRSFSLKACLLDLLLCLSARYDQLRTGYEQELDEAYQKSLLGYGQNRYFTESGRRIEAKIAGVDDFGRLILDIDKEGCRIFSHKEVEYIL